MAVPPKTAALSGVVAVVAVAEGTRADTAVVARSDQGATAMAVVIAGGQHMPVRAAVATVKAYPVNLAMGGPSMAVSAAMAMGRACHGNTTVVATLSKMAIALTATAKEPNTRITPAIAVMLARGSDRTLNVTITVAVVKGAPGSLRADSRPVAAAADSATALVADAPADDGKR